MAKRKRGSASPGEDLLEWLRGLDLPARVIGALRRDLEAGDGALAGLDRARFVEELYKEGGGQVRRVPAVAGGAIEALRAAIPPPAAPPALSPDDPEFVLPALDDDELAPAAPPAEEPPRPRRGRPRKREGAPSAGRSRPVPRPRAAAAPPPAPRADQPVQAAGEAPEMTFAEALQLWRRLHPQGQRAAQRYIASLLIEPHDQAR